jgi:hypothetical protein
MDWRELPLGTILSSELIMETNYKDGTMYVFEEKSVCQTPVRERDICIEYIFYLSAKEARDLKLKI